MGEGAEKLDSLNCPGSQVTWIRQPGELQGSGGRKLWKRGPFTPGAVIFIIRGADSNVHVSGTARVRAHVTVCCVDHHVACVKPFLCRESRFCLQLMHNKLDPAIYYIKKEIKVSFKLHPFKMFLEKGLYSFI